MREAVAFSSFCGKESATGEDIVYARPGATHRWLRLKEYMRTKRPEGSPDPLFDDNGTCAGRKDYYANDSIGTYSSRSSD